MNVRRALIAGCLIDLCGALVLAAFGMHGPIAICAGIAISVGSAFIALTGLLMHWQSDPQYAAFDVDADAVVPLAVDAHEPRRMHAG